MQRKEPMAVPVALSKENSCAGKTRPRRPWEDGPHKGDIGKGKGDRRPAKKETDHSSKKRGVSSSEGIRAPFKRAAADLFGSSIQRMITLDQPWHRRKQRGEREEVKWVMITLDQRGGWPPKERKSIKLGSYRDGGCPRQDGRFSGRIR